MEIVFMGTPKFAVPSLLGLIESKHNILAVVTQPDRLGEGVKGFYNRLLRRLHYNMGLGSCNQSE